MKRRVGDAQPGLEPALAAVGGDAGRAACGGRDEEVLAQRLQEVVNSVRVGGEALRDGAQSGAVGSLEGLESGRGAALAGTGEREVVGLAALQPLAGWSRGAASGKTCGEGLVESVIGEPKVWPGHLGGDEHRVEEPAEVCDGDPRRLVERDQKSAGQGRGWGLHGSAAARLTTPPPIPELDR